MYELNLIGKILLYVACTFSVLQFMLLCGKFFCFSPFEQIYDWVFEHFCDEDKNCTIAFGIANIVCTILYLGAVLLNLPTGVVVTTGGLTACTVLVSIFIGLVFVFSEESPILQVFEDVHEYFHNRKHGNK